MAKLREHPDLRYARIKTHLKLLKDQAEPVEYERFLLDLKAKVDQRLQNLYASWANTLVWGLRKIWEDCWKEMRKTQSAGEFYDQWIPPKDLWLEDKERREQKK